jgi:hypothetical protein
MITWRQHDTVVLDTSDKGSYKFLPTYLFNSGFRPQFWTYLRLFACYATSIIDFIVITTFVNFVKRVHFDTLKMRNFVHFSLPSPLSVQNSLHGILSRDASTDQVSHPYKSTDMIYNFIIPRTVCLFVCCLQT